MSDASNEPTSSDLEEAREQTHRIVRRLGYLLFIGGGFAMFVAMMVGVVEGVQHDRAWNPYTGQRHRQVDCLDRARRLMLDAGERRELPPTWTGRYRDWITSCRDNHPELYQLLHETRSTLRPPSDDG